MVQDQHGGHSKEFSLTSQYRTLQIYVENFEVSQQNSAGSHVGVHLL